MSVRRSVNEPIFSACLQRNCLRVIFPDTKIIFNEYNHYLLTNMTSVVKYMYNEGNSVRRLENLGLF